MARPAGKNQGFILNPQSNHRSIDQVVVILANLMSIIMGMIGYAFLTEKRYGFITPETYFLSQIAALYSNITVGPPEWMHPQGVPPTLRLGHINSSL